MDGVERVREEEMEYVYWIGNCHFKGNCMKLV
jgi:hypothetical protein